MTKIPRITTVCLDIDWTLIKHPQDETANLLRLLNHKPDEEFHNQVLYFWENLSERLQNGKPVKKEQIYYHAEEMIPYLSKLNLTGEKWYELQSKLNKPELIEGAYETLTYLQEQGYYIVASTNAFVSSQMNILKNLNILHFFERIYGWDTTCAKPQIRSLYMLLNTRRVEDIVFIGDSVYTDINLANRLGMKSIGINLKYKDKYKHIKPTFHISNLYEIKELL